MADASKYFAVRRLVTTSAFQAITVPIACGQVVIENGDTVNSQAVRTDPNDGDTEKTLPAQLELTLRAQAQCWEKGDIVCYVKAASGSGPIIVSFLR